MGTVTRESPEYRAAVVAGIRALADFVEQHTDLPVPQISGAQYSYLDTPYEDVKRGVRRAAESLGVEPVIEADHASVRVNVASGGYPSPLPMFSVIYTIHGSPDDLPADPDQGRTTAVAEAKPDTLVQPLGRAAEVIQPTESRPHSIGAGEQNLYRFDNGYGASVVRFEYMGAHSYGGEQGLWELAVLRFTGDGIDDCEITYSTPVTDDVIGWLDDDAVQEKLRQIRDLSKAQS